MEFFNPRGYRMKCNIYCRVLKNVANNKYLEFSKYEGSQHIASEFSIYHILRVIEDNDVKKILEIGLGIGTVPSAVFQCFRESVEYSGTEANKFCLESLKHNLKGESIKVYNDINTADLTQKFDLIIVDGKDGNLKKLMYSLSKRAIVMIEGDRKDQTTEMRSIFKKSLYVHLISGQKNHPDGPFDDNSWQGGIKVFYINPTFSQKISWMQQKIRTKFVYFKRKKLGK